MIISKTPYRVSLLGGGSDYPEIYSQVGYGATLVGAIDKFCYVTVRRFPPFFEHKSRAVWSKIENISDISRIENPVIRECLNFTGVRDVEIHHQGDIPAWSGMGTSSAFVVGLLNSLYRLKGETVGRMRLAKEAILIERDLIHDTVGIQDQIAVSHGGLSLVEISGNGETRVGSLGGPFIDSGAARARELDSYMMILFTGINRLSSGISREQVAKVSDKIELYEQIVGLAIGGAQIFDDENQDIRQIGELIEEGWQIKRRFSASISNPELDQTHDDLISAGAIGTKLLGAGAGGFFLVFADANTQDRIRARMAFNSIRKMIEVPFRFEFIGSRIIYENVG
jgi:D-glycero-alpha-D-manno-heptose-7-phosphate kinase